MTSGGTRAGVKESVAQTLALRRAHRTIVKIKREIADFVFFAIDNFPESLMVVRRIDSEWRFGRVAKERTQHLSSRQFDSGSGAELFSASFAADADLSQAADIPLRLIALRLQMGNPNGAIDGADADRAVTPRKNLTRRAS